MFAQVSTDIPTSKMKTLLHCVFSKECGNGLIDTNTKTVDKRHFLVLLNGSILGVTLDPAQLERTLIGMRRSQDMPYQMRIVWHRHRPMSRYFFINTDGSVALRPVYVVENLHKVVPTVQTTGSLPSLWTKLMNAGAIEFIDVEEQNSRELLVAVKSEDLKMAQKPWTHLEIDPTVALGLMAQLIPFSHMNQVSSFYQIQVLSMISNLFFSHPSLQETCTGRLWGNKPWPCRAWRLMTVWICTCM